MGSRRLQIFLLFIIQAMMSMSWKCQTEEYLSCPSNVIASAGKYVRLTCRLKNSDSLNWVFNSTNYISMGGHIDSSYNNKYNISNDGDLEIKAVMLCSVGRYDCQSTESGAHYYAEVYSFFSGPQCQYFKKGLDSRDATVNCSIDFAGNADVNILLEDSRGRVLYSDWKDSKLGITNVSFETPIEADATWYRISVDFHPKCNLVGGEECASNVAEFSKKFDTSERSPKHSLAGSSKTFDPTANSPRLNYRHESTHSDIPGSVLSYGASVITFLILFFIYKKHRHFCCKSAHESSISNLQNVQEVQREEPSGETTVESFGDTTHALANSTSKQPEEFCASTEAYPSQVQDDEEDDDRGNEQETMFNGSQRIQRRFEH